MDRRCKHTFRPDCEDLEGRQLLADGLFLYWGSIPLHTGSVPTGYEFAKLALSEENAQDIRTTPNEVTGHIGGTYISITCIATAPRVTAVVMVVGADGVETAHVRDAVDNDIGGIIAIDGGTALNPVSG